MLSKLKKNIFVKYFFGFMGLYLLNISVDAPDCYIDGIPEDLSYNDQESLLEMIVEQVLGFEDAFKEYDDIDHQDHSKNNKKQNIDFNYQNILSFNINQQTELSNLKFDYYQFIYNNVFLNIDTPPPKA